MMKLNLYFKKKLVVECMSEVFNLNQTEIDFLNKQIDFLFDNGKIKKITVMGNLSNNSYNFLVKLFNKKIINIKLPYGNIDSIINGISNYKISNHELIFITIPTPKQEMLAEFLSKKNKHFKSI